MKRIAFIVCGGAAVVGSYAAVIFGVAPEPSVGPVTFAGIALPGLVSGLVMTAYIAWEARNVRTAEGMAEELSAQLVRKEIEIGRLATVDELTGLATRREFDEDVRLEFARARRHGRDLSLLLVQIDDIVELGEHVGTLSKGYLLSEISSIIRRLLRAHDIGARYTPDSLAMLLPETSAAQARVVADKIRKAVASHDFLGELRRDSIRLTVSQGIASIATALESPADLLHAAEQAMYQARLAGFNQVRIADTMKAPPAGATATDAA